MNATIRPGDKVRYCSSEWYVVAELDDATLRIEQVRHYSDGDSICEAIVTRVEVRPA